MRDSGEKVSRLRIDIKDLDLTKVDVIQGKQVVAVGKHLCGGGTDVSLRCAIHLSNHWRQQQQQEQQQSDEKSIKEDAEKKEQQSRSDQSPPRFLASLNGKKKTKKKTKQNKLSSIPVIFAT